MENQYGLKWAHWSLLYFKESLWFQRTGHRSLEESSEDTAVMQARWVSYGLFQVHNKAELYVMRQKFASGILLF